MSTAKSRLHKTEVNGDAVVSIMFTEPYLDRDWYTEDEYFAIEDRSLQRWEFVADGPKDPLGRRLGSIRVMSGMSASSGDVYVHSAIAINVAAALTTDLRGTGNQKFRVFGSDLKVRTANGRNTYPDVSVVCGSLGFHHDRRDTVINPVLVAEVLSPSTALFDRGDKWASYQTIPSLKHYLLLAADKARVELYTRHEKGWLLETFEGLGTHISLSALNIILALADLYAQVEFDTDL